jgi:hypothetical protein
LKEEIRLKVVGEAVWLLRLKKAIIRFYPFLEIT